MEPKDCAVLVPIASVLEPETDAVLRVLAMRGYPIKTLRYCSQVDLARAILATDALRDGYAETMWIDSDVSFAADDVDRIRALNLPFTAGLYVKKGKQEFAAKFTPGTAGVTMGVDGGTVEMEYVGMGFTHVRREVYEAIGARFQFPRCGGSYDPAKTITPYFLPVIIETPAGHEYLSEDYSFCHRARQVGFPPMADTRLKIGHVGKKTYTWDDLAPGAKYEGLQLTFSTPEMIERTGG